MTFRENPDVQPLERDRLRAELDAQWSNDPVNIDHELTAQGELQVVAEVQNH
jgi:hypothetical protein